MRRLLEQSYLVRLSRDHARAPLRATLTAVGRPDVRHHFANLDELLAFLQTQASAAWPQVRGEIVERPKCVGD